jgi:bifunctional non-homologous end joining protein LigD
MTLTEVEGRRLPLTNLDKVLYPATGTTKGEVLHYYAAHAGTLIAHLQGRPLSFLRYPDGPEGQLFFSKNIPPGTPAWVRTCEVPTRNASGGRQVLIEDLPSLIWAANLVVEFHSPQWRAGSPAVADRLVLDLDPGAPATVVDCCEVALWLRDRLTEDGLDCYAKTSGAKGLHLLCPLVPAPAEDVTRYSMPFFVHPWPECVLRPLPSTETAQNPQKYPAITADAFQAAARAREREARPLSRRLLETGVEGEFVVSERDVPRLRQYLELSEVQRALPRGVSVAFGDRPDRQRVTSCAAWRTGSAVTPRGHERCPAHHARQPHPTRRGARLDNTGHHR